MSNIEAFGFIAGSLGSISLLPQLIKSWKTKSTRDISILWTSINLLGQAFWIYYGFLDKSQSLTIMSTVNFCLGFGIFYLKLKHG